MAVNDGSSRPKERLEMLTNGRSRRSGFAVRAALRCVLTALLCALVSGCATKTKKTESILLGDFPDRGPVVISAHAEQDAAAFSAAERELSEAEWDVLERFAPRNVWEDVRKLSRTVREARAAAATARARQATTGSAEIKQPDVVTETLDEDRVQFYYRVSHYGGVRSSSDAKSGLERRTVRHRPQNFAPLVELVKDRIGGKGKVTPLESENTLVVQCPAAMKQSVLELLARVDVPLPQVEISARIFEADHAMDFQSGVKLLVTYAGRQDVGLGASLSAQRFANAVTDPIGGTLPDPGAAARIINIFNSSGWSSDMTIQALSQSGLIKVISSPRMTVSAGQTGYMHAGQELPIASAKVSNESIVTEKTTYKPVGVQLYVTPEVIGPDSVRLHVVTIVSSVAGFQQLSGLDGVQEVTINPVIDTREAETHVTVRNGDSLVIGGLRAVRSISREDKVPGLGDIPILGWLFKNHRSQKQITDLYFFVTPQIVQP